MTFSLISCIHIDFLSHCHACGHDLLPSSAVYIAEVDGSTMQLCQVCYKAAKKQVRDEEEAAEESARLAAEECEA